MPFLGLAMSFAYSFVLFKKNLNETRLHFSNIVATFQHCHFAFQRVMNQFKKK